MGVQFEWRFDEDERLSGGERSGDPGRGGRISLRAIVRKVRRVAVSFRKRASRKKADDPYLSARQRRLHSALARTRPWLCPYGRRE
jgi:hypothetical protein